MSIDYTKQASESIEEYNTRISTTRGDNATETPSTGFNADFFNQLSERLLSDTSVSSQESPIVSKIQESIAGIKAGAEAEDERIESVFGREIESTRKTGETNLTSAQESQRGFAVNNARLSQIKQDTEKSVRDLEQRKQELLLSGDSAAAFKISELQLKEIEFEQTARQQAITNMFSLAGLGMQMKSEDRQASQFEANMKLQRDQFDQRNKESIASIASEYGVSIEAGETLESIVNKVKPMASALKKAELAKLLEVSKEEQDEFDVIALSNTSMNSVLMGKIDGFGTTPDEAVKYAISDLKSAGIKVTDKMVGELYREASLRRREIDANKQEQDLETKQQMDAISSFYKSVKSSPETTTSIPSSSFPTSGSDFGMASGESFFSSLYGE